MNTDELYKTGSVVFPPSKPPGEIHCGAWFYPLDLSSNEVSEGVSLPPLHSHIQIFIVCKTWTNIIYKLSSIKRNLLIIAISN